MAEFTGKKRKYVKGSARAKQFDNGGENIYLSLLFSDIEKLEKNADGYVKLVVQELKEEDKYGNTHSVFENDWKPDFSKPRAITPQGGNASAKATKLEAAPWDDPFK